MVSADQKKNYAAGAGFLLVLVLIFFRENISDSDLYQKTFHRERWEQKARNLERSMARLNSLDRQLCAVYVDAVKLALPIDIERDTELGLGYDEALKIENDAFEFDRMMCEKYGISPVARSRDTHQ